MTEHTGHVDLNVANHPTTSPESDPELMANPLRAYLEALALDLLAGMATLNWQPSNLHVKGEVAATKRALARALEHSYGLRYMDAFRMVEGSASVAVGQVKINDPEWQASKGRRVDGLMHLLFEGGPL